MSTESIICGICQEQVTDPIMMSCEAMHKFCFKCTLEYIDVKKTIQSCPCCRNGGRYIIIPQQNTQNTQNAHTNFFTISYFKNMLSIIEKIIKISCKGSCVISDNVLSFYVRNKKNIQMYNTLRSNDDYKEDTDEELISRFKWDVKSPNRNFYNYMVDVGTRTEQEVGSDFVNAVNSIATDVGTGSMIDMLSAFGLSAYPSNNANNGPRR